MTGIEVPTDVADNVIDLFGDRGDAWLENLPTVVSKLCRSWKLRVESAAMTGGTHSFVVEVKRADESAAVLKVPVVDDENAAEATALFHYGGDGAARLYEFDPSTGAMLIELAEPGQPLVRQDVDGPHLEGLPENEDRLRFACARFRRLWRIPSAAPSQLPSLPLVTQMLRNWAASFPGRAGRLGGRVPAGLTERFAELCRAYARPTGPQGIANRDTHLGNIVSAQRMPWLLIDPKPFYGERAFDAGFLTAIVAESLPEPAALRVTTDRIAVDLGVAPFKVRGWGFLRLMENAVVAVESDDPIAERLIEASQLLSKLGNT